MAGEIAIGSPGSSYHYYWRAMLASEISGTPAIRLPWPGLA
jgi:hypothetical protein